MYKSAFNRDFIAFTELGGGSQFRAYDMGDGRVLKLPLTQEETAAVVSKRRHNMQPLSKVETASVEARVQTAMNGKGRIPAMISHSFYNAKDFLAILGNPILVDVDKVLPKDSAGKHWGNGRVIYTQDKLSMVGIMLDAFADIASLGRGDVLRLKQIIDAYVQQTYRLWDYGFSDYACKIGDAGFDKDGGLIIADLGEFSSDPVFILKVIADQRWLHSTVSDKIDFPQIPKPLHEYYIKTLENAFTEKHFLAHWCSKHQCSACDIVGGDVISDFITAKMAEIDYVDRW